MRNMGDRSDHARDAAIAIEIIEGERQINAQIVTANGRAAHLLVFQHFQSPPRQSSKDSRDESTGTVHWH